MNKIAIFAFSICMGIFLSAGVVSEAEAKRLGGGGSFGSKMFQKKPAKQAALGLTEGDLRCKSIFKKR